MKRVTHEDVYAGLHFSLYGVHASPYIRQTLLVMAVPGYEPNNHPAVDRVFGKEGNQVALVRLQKNRILNIVWCYDGVLLTHQYDKTDGAARLSLRYQDVLRMMDVTDNLGDVRGVLRTLMADQRVVPNTTIPRVTPLQLEQDRRGYMIEALEAFIRQRSAGETQQETS